MAVRSQFDLSSVVGGTIAGLAAVAMWAAYFARVGTKAGLMPANVVALRFVMAGAIMLPWLLVHRPKDMGCFGW